MGLSKPAVVLALSLFSITVATRSALSQGLSEMGAAHAMSATLGSGLHSQAGRTTNGLNSTYGSLNKQMNLLNGGSSGGGSAGGGGLDVLGDPVDPRLTVKNAGADSNHLYDLAVQKQRAGKNAEAEKLYRQSLAIRQNIWGARDPAVPRLISTIAELQRKRGDLDGAEASYRDLLKMQLKVSGAGSPELVPILEKLGVLCYDQKKYSESENYLLQVYTQRSRKSGVENKETIRAALELAQTRLDGNDPSGAAEVLKPSIDVMSAKDTSSPQMIKLLQAYAGVLRKQNKAEDLAQVESKLQSLKPGPVAKTEAPEGSAPSTVEATKENAAESAPKVDTKSTESPSVTPTATNPDTAK